jgi:hypothetical protein
VSSFSANAAGTNGLGSSGDISMLAALPLHYCNSLTHPFSVTMMRTHGKSNFLSLHYHSVEEIEFPQEETDGAMPRKSPSRKMRKRWGEKRMVYRPPQAENRCPPSNERN